MPSRLTKEIVNTLQTVVGDSAVLHEPEFSGNEAKYVNECIETGWVSSVGKFVDRFENDLADITGAKYAIAMVNGTAALHVSLLLSGVQEDDEVLVPALSFIATANAVVYCHAEPHFVDSSFSTLGIDPLALDDYLSEIAEVKSDGFLYNKKTGKRISAIVAMHAFGHPVDIDALLDVANKYSLAVVEDAAESLGSYSKDRHTGSIAPIGAISFNGNKVLTTGGGGAIITNDEKIGKLAKHITTTARVVDKWFFKHDMTGFNYRMPNLNAALGCGQLENLDKFISEKRRLAGKYIDAFSILKGVLVFKEPSDCKSNYWLNTLLLDKENVALRDEVLTETNNAGFMTRPAWILLNEHPMYASCPAMDMPVSTELEKRIINIPSSAKLGRKDA